MSDTKCVVVAIPGDTQMRPVSESSVTSTVRRALSAINRAGSGAVELGGGEVSYLRAHSIAACSGANAVQGRIRFRTRTVNGQVYICGYPRVAGGDA